MFPTTVEKNTSSPNIPIIEFGQPLPIRKF
jgi:hypothetical protein